ncbi:DUF349 domain-containing protein [Marinobacter sp. SS21]|uniref:DUF349 domain-containing protein n=1 Tax=Marinobacter sp. SS21 TaxID=2979460 RepID=UPI00232D948F|nr:DUF349 domain-containing protein [Marinobacter sp. SS21]MDC0664257.1 DUF349 domain-containing protein [Marinobacter sp. SS21]
MAAFIQKLFKNRKPSPPPEPETAAPQKQDQQAELREHQSRLLEGAPSQQQLEELALTGLTADLRRRAAAAIDDRAALQRLLKASKGKDKSVYQVVRQTLQGIRDEEERQRRVTDQIQALIKQADEQARSEDTKLYQARLEALQNQWKEVEPQASPEQVTAFLNAVSLCRSRQAALANEAAERQRHQDQAEQRTSTLTLLGSTLNELKGRTTDTFPSVSALDALQKTQEIRWLEATRDTAVEKAEQKEYEVLMQAIKSCIAGLRRAGQQREAIEQLIADQASNQGDLHSRASSLLEAIDWPKGMPLPSELQQLRIISRARPEEPAASNDSEDQKAQSEALKCALDALEATLEARQLKESRQHFKKAQHLAKSLDQRQLRPLSARLQLLGGQLRDLNDWQGFATHPKQIALCEQMEYLADQPMEPEAKAERIKELQNDWRKLGGSSDRTLWTRFKQASDRAYEPCQAYFSVKSDLKQGHLNKRRAICEQLQQFIEQTDWNDVDWKAIEQIHRTARDEWKAAWPVDFRDNRSVQKQFDDILKQIEKPLNEERQRNEQRKQAIVDEAVQLIKHEPLADAMERAKALQNQWRSIGITRHREDRKLWRAFRQACDTIFARRDAQRSEREQQVRAADQQALAELTQTSSITPETGTREAVRQALDSLASLNQAAVSRAVQGRLSEERNRLHALQSTLAMTARTAQWRAQIEACQGHHELAEPPTGWHDLARPLQELSARELVIRAEILTARPSPEADQALRMEIQVKRLSNGLNGTAAEPQAEDLLESLVAHWCLAVPAADRNEKLTQRLLDALASTER